MGTKSGKAFAAEYLRKRAERSAQEAAEGALDLDLNTACDLVGHHVGTADLLVRQAWKVILDTLAQEF